MMEVRVAACAVAGPGLPDWATAQEVLAGRRPYVATAVAEPNPVLLPPNERRRASGPARWVLAVGHAALQASGLAATDVATVLTSSGSDGHITDQICKALATNPIEVSPTRFHNSVHNAPGGYWSIALASRAPSTSLCAGSGSFGAGLLEAAAQVTVEQRAVLVIAYDLPYPEPLSALWPLRDPFAVAMMLVEPSRGNGPTLSVSVDSGAGTPHWPTTLPRDLADNPAAAALPLLALLACRAPGTIILPYLARCRLVVELRE